MILSQQQQLQQTIGLYERLLQAYTRLESEMSRRHLAAVQDCMDEISELMAQIEANPAESELLSDSAEPVDAADLIARLQRLVRAAAARNQALSQKGRSIMAVVADEMHRTGENRALAAGYGGPRQTTGGRINIPSA